MWYLLDSCAVVIWPWVFLFSKFRSPKTLINILRPPCHVPEYNNLSVILMYNTIATSHLSISSTIFKVLDPQSLGYNVSITDVPLPFHTLYCLWYSNHICILTQSPGTHLGCWVVHLFLSHNWIIRSAYWVISVKGRSHFLDRNLFSFLLFFISEVLK